MDTNIQGAPNQGSLGADILPILPLRDAVLFPGAVMPLAAGSPTAVAAMQAAAQDGHTVFVVLQRDPSTEQPAQSDLHPIGVEARLLRYVTAQDGSHHAIVQGIARARLLEWAPQSGFPAARIERLPEPEERGPEIDALFHQLRERALETLALLEQAAPALAATIRASRSCPIHEAGMPVDEASRPARVPGETPHEQSASISGRDAVRPCRASSR